MEKNNRLFLQQAKKEKHIVKQRTFEFIKKKTIISPTKNKIAFVFNHNYVIIRRHTNTNFINFPFEYLSLNFIEITKQIQKYFLTIYKNFYIIVFQVFH